MKPYRDFKFRGKKEIFAIVGFKYDSPSSIEYDQYKQAESVSQTVLRLLTMEDGADIISIRRVYLAPEREREITTSDEKVILQ